MPLETLRPSKDGEPVAAERCDACGSEEFRMLYDRAPDRRHWLGVFDILQCERCGTGRTSPRPSEREIGRFYPAGYGSFVVDAPPRGAAFRIAKAVVRAPALLRYGSPKAPLPAHGDARVLDIGSGTGDRLAALAADGWQITGVEPDTHAVALGRERHPALRDGVTIGKVEDAHFANDSFDLIIMEHVLEHLYAPLDVLALVRTWLREGGTLQLSLPNFAAFERRAFGRWWYGLDLPRHLNHFTEQSIQAVLVARGFTVERVVPEIQASTLAGSIHHLLDSLRHRRDGDHPGSALYFLVMPIAAALQAAGHRPTLVITARAT